MATGLENLKIYQMSRELELKVFELTKKFPKDEFYRSVDQVRRSSSSVTNNIAEGYGKQSQKERVRIFPAPFVSAWAAFPNGGDWQAPAPPRRRGHGPLPVSQRHWREFDFPPQQRHLFHHNWFQRQGPSWRARQSEWGKNCNYFKRKSNSLLYNFVNETKGRNFIPSNNASIS